MINKVNSDGDEKAQAILSAIDREVEFFIETGTGGGETLNSIIYEKAFLHHFTIELDYPTYVNAIIRFIRRQDVTSIFGDSVEILPRLLDHLNSKCLIWLDAHSAINDGSCPLFEELAAIFYRSREHIILIDDARLMGVWNNWPTLNEIQEIAKTNNYSYKLIDDIIYLYPEGK